MIEHYSKKIQNVIQKELFKAQKSIKIAVAWFTNDLLFQPLLLKLQAGVCVELIINKDEINDSVENDIDFSEFVNNGGILHWNDSKRLMHDKFCIIDGDIVIYGSYNWTNKAEYNDESITVSRNEDSTVEFYKGIFENLRQTYPAESISEKQHTSKDTFLNNAETIYTLHDVKLMKNRNMNSDHDVFRLYDKVSNTQITSDDYDTVIYNTNSWSNGIVIAMKKENKWFFFNAKEKFLDTSISYEDVQFISIYNSFWIKKNCLWGIMKDDGEIVLPCNYDKIQIKDNNFIIIGKGGKFGVFDWHNYIWDCVWDSIEIVYGDVLKVRKNGKYGITESNKLIVKCEYDDLSHSNDKQFVALKNGKYGIVDSDRELAPCIYDEIKIHNTWECCKYYLRKNGKYGLIVDNELKYECIFDELYADRETPSKINGKMGVLDRKGNEMIAFEYDSIQYFKSFYDFPYSAFKDFFIVCKKLKGKHYYGVFLCDNTEQIECTYQPLPLLTIPDYNGNILEKNNDTLIESLRITFIKTILCQTLHPTKLTEIQEVEKNLAKEKAEHEDLMRRCKIRTDFDYSVLPKGLFSHRSRENSTIQAVPPQTLSIKIKHGLSWDFLEKYPFSILELDINNSFEGGLCPMPDLEIDDIIELPNSPRVLHETTDKQEYKYIVVKVRNERLGKTKYIRFHPSIINRGSKAFIFDDKDKKIRKQILSGSLIDYLNSMNIQGWDELYSKLTSNYSSSCKIKVSDREEFQHPNDNNKVVILYKYDIMN